MNREFFSLTSSSGLWLRLLVTDFGVLKAPNGMTNKEFYKAKRIEKTAAHVPVHPEHSGGVRLVPSLSEAVRW